MEVLSTVVGFVGTILASLWLVYSTLLQIPVINILVIVGTIVGLYLLHRKLPRTIQEQIGGRIGPSLWLISRPVRWPLGYWLTSDHTGDGRTKVVEKVVERRVPARQSFRAWLTGGLKWGIFWGILALVVYEYQVLVDLFSRAL